MRRFILDVLPLSWPWATPGRLSSRLTLGVRSQALGGDWSVSSTPSDSRGCGRGEMAERGAEGREWAQVQLRNVGLREGQPRTAAGGHRRGVREVRAGWPRGRRTGRCSNAALPPTEGRAGKRVLGRAAEVGPGVQG